MVQRLIARTPTLHLDNACFVRFKFKFQLRLEDFQFANVQPALPFEARVRAATAASQD